MRNSLRVVDFIVDFLRRQEVGHVFGVGGANIEDLYDAIHCSGTALRGVVAKHEFSAATMADGYHRASQRMAVIASTSGAGAMNLVPGLAELRASCVPALALIGQPPASQDGYGSFQETSGLAGSIDAVRMFSEIAVYCARVDDPGSITEELPRALAAAADPAAPGPAVLLLPKDVQQAVIPAWAPPEPPAPAFPALSHAAERERAVGLLRSARHFRGVVVVAGAGVARADARSELARLAEVLGAQVAVAPDAKDVFDGTSPRSLGVVGAIGRAEVQETLEQASAVLLVGTRLPQLAGAGLRDHLKGVPVVCVDSRPPFLDEHEDLVRLSGPLACELSLLTAALTGLDPVPPPVGAIRGARPTVLAPSGPLDMRTSALTIAAALPERANVVADAGNAGAVAIHHVGVPVGGRFITALGMGGMGHSFGAGVGAAFATGMRTYVLAGDGAFFMHGMEIHTAVEHQLPVTFVVFNNNAHGMCHIRERLFYSDDYSYNLFRPARIGDGVAVMFPGLDAVTVHTTHELRTALLRANASRSPSLVCINVNHTEMPPFRPFLQLATAAGKPAGQ